LFEFEKLLSSTSPGLPVMTLRGSPIPTLSELNLAPSDRKTWQRLAASHKSWLERRVPTARYNCAGLAWSSRRTWVDSADQTVDLIRVEDQYSVLPRTTEAIREGDLVVYFLAGQGARRQFFHVGQVVSIGQGNPWEANTLVLSKFGWGAEVRHFLHEIPDRGFQYIEHEFWRES